LSAKNSQKLCSQHSQLAKAAKKRTSKKHTIDIFEPWVSMTTQGMSGFLIAYLGWALNSIPQK